ncbi:MAG: SPOR domain-containing protein [Gallionella sp.]|nr:MAG: SPOR domain-containing protein [Gallionella sp.]
MSRNTNNKPAAPRKNGNPLLTGILVGMVIGVGMAAGLAWYIMKSPSPFVQKEPVAPRPAAETARPAAPAGAATPGAQPATAASGVGEGKPRFEFYNVLTDKQDTAAAASAKPADKPQTPAGKPAAANEPQFLQAGSFSNQDDAEKLKARLALQGIETGIQTVTIPDKGVWHRVRLGPYMNADEMNRARSLLKQNGVDATPTRAQ